MNMIKIRMKDTGHVKEVTKNEAYDLIDRGLAEYAPRVPDSKDQTYKTRQIRAKQVINK